jgi:hypothetical protein
LIAKAKQEYRIHMKVKKSKFFSFVYNHPNLWPMVAFYTLMLTVFLIVFSYRYDNFEKKPDRPQILGYMYNFQMPGL